MAQNVEELNKKLEEALREIDSLKKEVSEQRNSLIHFYRKAS